MSDISKHDNMSGVIVPSPMVESTLWLRMKQTYSIQRNQILPGHRCKAETFYQQVDGGDLLEIAHSSMGAQDPLIVCKGCYYSWKMMWNRRRTLRRMHYWLIYPDETLENWKDRDATLAKVEHHCRWHCKLVLLIHRECHILHHLWRNHHQICQNPCKPNRLTFKQQGDPCSSWMVLSTGSYL